MALRPRSRPSFGRLLLQPLDPTTLIRTLDTPRQVLPRSLIARWMDWSDSYRESILPRNVSDPLEVRNLVSISSVTRMTSSSPVNRKNYWKEKSNLSLCSSCKDEVLNFLRPRPSLRRWSTVLISSDKTCADTLTGNCSSSLPRRMLEPS